MKYKDPFGTMYLIYLYSDRNKIWKIEHIPFDDYVSMVSPEAKDKFISDNHLVEV